MEKMSDVLHDSMRTGDRKEQHGLHWLTSHARTFKTLGRSGSSLGISLQNDRYSFYEPAKQESKLGHLSRGAALSFRRCVCPAPAFCPTEMRVAQRLLTA